MIETTTIIRSRINRRVMSLALLTTVFVMVWLFADIYLYAKNEAALVIEIAALVVILAYLLRRMGRRCQYRLDSRSLEFVQHSLWGQQLRARVELQHVVALYQGRPRKFGPLRCKDTVLVHAALDASKVWALVYRLPADVGDAAYRRIFFKPGELLLAKLQECLRSRLYRSEEELFLDIDL